MFGKLKAMLGGKDVAAAGEIAEVVVQTTHCRVPGNAGADRPDAPAGAGEGGAEAFLDAELRAARKIQMSMMPKTFPPIPGCPPFDLYAVLEPARAIGGDFYDFWLNGRDNLVLAIGDVSGGGVPAALFMAVCRTYLRAFSRSIPAPSRLLEYLNDEMGRHNESGMFVTLFCASIHLPTGRVEYANAGHNPPFVKRRDGTAGALELAGDMPVGLMPGRAFAARSLTLAAGDSILFYTDGMPEACDASGDMLGGEESLRLFGAAPSGGCRTAIGQLRAEIDEFVGEAKQSDDITLMMYTQLEQTPAAPRMSRRVGNGGSPAGDPGAAPPEAGSPPAAPEPLRFEDGLGQTLSGFRAAPPGADACGEG